MSLRILAACTLLSMTFLAGCGGSDPVTPAQHGHNHEGETDAEHAAHADPHDVPLTDSEISKLREDTATWKSAVEHIQKFRDTIKTETTNGTPAKAHRSLDLAEVVLEALPETAQSSGVAKDDWQTVGESTQAIRDAFNRVHERIDAGESPKYEDEAEAVDSAVAKLAAIKAGESNASEPAK